MERDECKKEVDNYLHGNGAHEFCLRKINNSQLNSFDDKAKHTKNCINSMENLTSYLPLLLVKSNF